MTSNPSKAGSPLLHPHLYLLLTLCLSSLALLLVLDTLSRLWLQGSALVIPSSLGCYSVHALTSFNPFLKCQCLREVSDCLISDCTFNPYSHPIIYSCFNFLASIFNHGFYFFIVLVTFLIHFQEGMDFYYFDLFPTPKTVPSM